MLVSMNVWSGFLEIGGVRLSSEDVRLLPTFGALVDSWETDGDVKDISDKSLQILLEEGAEQWKQMAVKNNVQGTKPARNEKEKKSRQGD